MRPSKRLATLLAAAGLGLPAGLALPGCVGPQVFHQIPDEPFVTAPAASPDRTLSLARQLERSGASEDAIKMYEAVLQSDPHHTSAHHRLGVLLAKRGDLAEAESHLRTALKQNPTNVELLNDVGYCCFLQRRLDEAEPFFRKALEINPNHSTSRNNLARVTNDRKTAPVAAPAPTKPEPAVVTYEPEVVTPPPVVTPHPVVTPQPVVVTSEPKVVKHEPLVVRREPVIVADEPHAEVRPRTSNRTEAMQPIRRESVVAPPPKSEAPEVVTLPQDAAIKEITKTAEAVAPPTPRMPQSTPRVLVQEEPHEETLRAPPVTLASQSTVAKAALSPAPSSSHIAWLDVDPARTTPRAKPTEELPSAPPPVQESAPPPAAAPRVETRAVPAAPPAPEEKAAPAQTAIPARVATLSTPPTPVSALPRSAPGASSNAPLVHFVESDHELTDFSSAPSSTDAEYEHPLRGVTATSTESTAVEVSLSDSTAQSGSVSKAAESNEDEVAVRKLTTAPADSGPVRVRLSDASPAGEMEVVGPAPSAPARRGLLHSLGILDDEPHAPHEHRPAPRPSRPMESETGGASPRLGGASNLQDSPARSKPPRRSLRTSLSALNPFADRSDAAGH